MLLQLSARLVFILSRSRPLPPPTTNEPSIQAIAERIRAVVSRQPGHNVDIVAQTLALPAHALRRLLDAGARTIDATFLIDVVAALVHEAGVDPHWLLTGHCDPSMHRHALLLGEDRSPGGAEAIRAFVQGYYQQLRNGATLLSLPPNVRG